MRFTVQYIPLNKLRPGISVQLTQRIKSLRKAAQDCMHLMVVRKSRKHGGYIIVSGNHHYEFLRKHTKNTVAPCLVDQGKTSERVESLIHYFRKPNLPYEVPRVQRDRTSASSWSIIRKFLRQEPRFRQLSRTQQLKVLRLAIQYRKTTIQSMKAKVDGYLRTKKTG
ncbi:hypothetical protein [Paenibacillus sp. oral taxon 786]|uniref:hypothetical protein n=1 Tax=Paenibacillus sp. oral taxon 786 TaxID=652715 RepID=UPI00055CC23D|nr:hypothetical protein [Paenibacillus sp. oral taxon 786]